MPPLATLGALSSDPSALGAFLTLLLELTPAASVLLVGALLPSLAADPPREHGDVLDRAEEVVRPWAAEGEGKVGLVEGHPRIGEGDVLSDLSRREQAGGPPTTQATLDRLKVLNASYEHAFPRLRYVTFVNGRSRAAIVPELERLVGDGTVRPVGSAAWRAECERAVRDVWRIGRARLEGQLLSAAEATA